MKLRELKEKDIEGMLEWMHSETSREVFAKDFNKYTADDVRDFVLRKDESELNYACVDDNDNYLGTVSLKNIDKENKNAEYAISFRENARGTGASGFATREILRIAFSELGLNKVYLNVLDINGRAIGFYKKMGFVEEGRFREHIFKGGKFRDLIWYSILSKDWKNDE